MVDSTKPEEEIETISVSKSTKDKQCKNPNEIIEQGYMNEDDNDEDNEEDDDEEDDDEEDDEEYDGIPGLFGGMDLSECLNTFLTNQNEENIADILTGFKKSLDTQNKILMKILGAIQNMS